MPINKEWHERNKMPRSASFEERVAWHTEHQKQCACRPIPQKLAREIKEKN